MKRLLGLRSRMKTESSAKRTMKKKQKKSKKRTSNKQMKMRALQHPKAG